MGTVTTAPLAAVRTRPVASVKTTVEMGSTRMVGLARLSPSRQTDRRRENKPWRGSRRDYSQYNNQLTITFIVKLLLYSIDRPGNFALYIFGQKKIF